MVSYASDSILYALLPLICSNAWMIKILCISMKCLFVKTRVIIFEIKADYCNLNLIPKDMVTGLSNISVPKSGIASHNVLKM